MKIVDSNVLLNAMNEELSHHRSARAWLEAALSGREAIGFAWISLVAFLRIGTRSGVFRDRFSISDAFDLVQEWLAARPAIVVHPTVRHFEIVRGLLEPIGSGGNLVNDAHLAALAVEHAATVVTFDRDFGRFRGVRLEEPTELA
jgi:toxin-antitoxin system PIN domain toxin